MKHRIGFRKSAGVIATYVAAVVVALVFISPILWALNLSLKSRLDIFAWPPAIIGFQPTLVNFQAVFSPNGHFVSTVVNSIFVALGATVVAILVGAAASFGMSGERAEAIPRSARSLALWMLLFRMAPPVALIIPYYLVFRALGLIGTDTALIISHSAFALAVSIFIIRGFFDEVPREIEEAARIDGASTWQIFLLIILPISKAVLAASCIFAFITSWNEFLFVSLLSGASSQTLPVAISGYVAEVYTSWGELAAATVVGVVPALIFAFFGQRYLLAGLAPGAVK